MSDRQAGGLFVNGARVPLKGVNIHVKVSGAASETCVSQRYKNVERVPVEAVYSFPLEESSAVSGFEVEIGGKIIKGKIEERDKAFEEYDEAMAQGHGAFLVDQDRPNIFTASVGNLLPDQEAVVRLRYVSELEQNGDAMRVLIPTTISPRYIPLSEMKKMDPAELDHIAPPTVAGGVPYGLRLKVEIEAASAIRGVECPSHPAGVTMDGNKASVELSGTDIQLDRDFVLNIKLAKPHEASALVARDGDGTRAVMLNFYPDLKSFKRGPCEFVFILDRSGSMEGESIARARAALLLALRSLEEGDRFNIVSFGNSHDALFKESAAYNQKSLDEATKAVEAMGADMGGTELLGPLQFVLEGNAQPPHPGPLPRRGEGERLPRQVVLLTDGQVGNEGQCIALAGKHAASCRIFTFGIGQGVSEHLVKGIARASGGQADFIHPNERIEPKVLRQFARMSSAFLKNVRVDWGTLKTDLVAPSSAPQLFDGDRLTLYARVTGGANCEAAIVADSPDGELRFPVSVDLERASDSRAIPVLMARKAIQELEEGLAAHSGSAQANRKKNTKEARILELALRYQIMSSATSFVAVEERAANAKSAPAQLRRVPIALTKGWGGSDEGRVAGAAPGTAMMPPVVMCAAPRLVPSGSPMPAMSRVRAAVSSSHGPSAEPREGLLKKAAKALFGGGPPKDVAPPPPTFGHVETLSDVSELNLREQVSRKSGGDELLHLAKSQRADGSFDAGKEWLKAAGITGKMIDAACDQLGGARGMAEGIVVTLMALHVLEKNFADRRDEWKMMADKAERWLGKKKVAIPAGCSSWKEWIAAQVMG